MIRNCISIIEHNVKSVKRPRNRLIYYYFYYYYFFSKNICLIGQLTDICLLYRWRLQTQKVHLRFVLFDVYNKEWKIFSYEFLSLQYLTQAALLFCIGPIWELSTHTGNLANWEHYIFAYCRNSVSSMVPRYYVTALQRNVWVFTKGSSARPSAYV